jgi:hypothetical protein
MGEEGIILPVKWRGGFADRNMHFPISTDIQIDSLDDRVRTRIYNLFSKITRIRLEQINHEERERFVNSFLQEFYLTDYDYNAIYYKEGTGKFLEATKETIYKDHWSNVFSFIEFWMELEDRLRSFTFGKVKDDINNIFEKEFVGYRLIENYIVPITDEFEINAIEENSNIPYSEVKEHISKALEKLSNRDNPDYENSIKESISSVETMARIITDKESATLGDALKTIEDKGITIHPALKKAFLSLYGYTSDESGVRHSKKLGSSNSTFEEAKFMLVACSAFNNYLLSNTK